MSTSIKPRSFRQGLLRTLAAMALAAAASQAMALDVTLCAERFAQDLPGKPGVPMWGYRQVADAAACFTPDAVPASPGPLITLPPTDGTLNITLVNRLTVPTSIVLAGQALPSNGGAPVLAADLVGPSCVPTPGAAASAPEHPQNCRVRSFTGETAPEDPQASAPANARTYTFLNLKPGTYLYQSGTHPQVQVQMGLFGMMRKDAGVAGQLFAGGGAYDADVPVVLSEIDPDQHDRIASTLGSTDPSSWKAGSNSTLNYAPRYFLINGKVFAGVDAGNVAATDLRVNAPAASRLVLRLANAGLTSRALMLNQGTWRLLTEDGNPYPAAREQATALLPAGKTTDALLSTPLQSTGSVDRSLALFDRRGGTDNADGSAIGGQVARLVMTSTGDPVNHPPVVNAGPDMTAYQTGSATVVALQGSVSDDGLGTQPLSRLWTQLGGPGAAVFADPSLPTTNVSFPVAGAYTLRLTASDGEFTVSDDVVVTVVVPNTHVSSLTGTVLTQTTTSWSAAVTVTVHDALHQSVNGAVVSGSWAYGAGSGTGGSTNGPVSCTTDATGSCTMPSRTGIPVSRTSMVFTVGGISSTAGVYLASANEAGAATVTRAQVNAGADLTVPVATTTTPNATASLSGTVSQFTGTPTLAWTRSSGPNGGTVTFSAPSALLTDATFSVPGTYTLTLTATLGGIVASDTVQVTVAPNKHVGALTATATGTTTWAAAVTVTVHDALHNPLAGVTVNGTWASVSGSGSNGSGGSSCTTAANGACTLTRTGIASTRTGVSLTVSGMTGVNTSGSYSAAASEVTSITVTKP